MIADNLKPLGELEELTLTGAGTEELLDAVVQLKKLRRLTLVGAVTDAGLGRLQGLTHLQSLNLDGTAVTDAGVKRLKGLGELQTLKLRRTGVTRAGVRELAAALPNATIIISASSVRNVSQRCSDFSTAAYFFARCQLCSSKTPCLRYNERIL